MLRRLAGKSARAALMAACTSRAALSILRFRSNCSVTRVCPVLLFDVISLTPEMVPSVRSSGVATVRAMSDGLAPGMLALTLMTGKSTVGKRAMGSMKNAPMPASAMPSVSSTVAMGRSMNGRDRFTPRPRWRPARRGSGQPLQCQFGLQRPARLRWQLHFP